MRGGRERLRSHVLCSEESSGELREGFATVQKCWLHVLRFSFRPVWIDVRAVLHHYEQCSCP